MSNVIKAEFGQDADSGYLIKDDKKITGVYVKNIAAMVDYDNVYLGTKGDDGIDDALLTNMEDINQFCLMWLLIFNPGVIETGGE
jgi:hypothetical protein